MCGILGIWTRGRVLPPPVEVGSALGSIRHRGPDDEGYVYLDTSAHAGARTFAGPDTHPDLRAVIPALGTVAPPAGADLVLASRRLAILDLSSAGHQPMASEDGQLWLVYNGEVYNYREVRGELERLGHRFHTGADTEVVLHAYREWGLDCLPRLNGMWGFAIWDGRRRTLVLARDRFGIKPLVYRWDGQTLMFASEQKALVSLVRARPNERVVARYLSSGLADETEETFFEGISQLEPGHVLELPLDAGAPRVRRWYGLPLEPVSSGAYAERFRDLFEDAVHLRLISDVPVGTCLSGGLDSSSIVCMVDALLRQGDRAGAADRQLTFSARYAEPRYDEGRWIDAVRGATAIEAHDVHPDSTSLEHDLERLVWHQDEPFGSTSIYAQWCVFRLARQHGVVVTLDGQGGDEVLAGYTYYFGDNLARLLRAGQLARFAREAAAYRRNHGVAAPRLAAEVVGALLPVSIRDGVAASLHDPGWLTLPVPPRPRPPRLGDPLRTRLHWSLTVRLRQLLRFADRNSMAHSVESRLPFLDYRLVELAFTAPAEAKIDDGTTKVMLREGLRDVLPALVRRRQSKLGFETPQSAWFRGELRHLAESVIRSPSFRSRPYFDHAAVERTYNDHLSGRADNSAAIWRWINFEFWARAFLD